MKELLLGIVIGAIVGVAGIYAVNMKSNTTQRRKLVQLQADYKILQSKNEQIVADAKTITDSKAEFDKKLISAESKIKKFKQQSESKDNAIRSLSAQLIQAQRDSRQKKTYRGRKVYKKKTRKTKRTSKVKKVKSARQIAKETKYRKLISEKKAVLKTLGSKSRRTGLYRELMLANEVIGRVKRKKAVSSVNKKINRCNSAIRLLDIKIKRLK